jgi:hypothetical protein
VRSDGRCAVELHIDAACDHVSLKVTAAFIGHMQHVDAGHRFENLDGQMRKRKPTPPDP